MTSGHDDSPDLAQRAERLVRLYRMTVTGDMGETTRGLVKQLLLAELGRSGALPPALPDLPAPLAPAALQPPPAGAGAAAEPASPVRHRPPEELELRLRRLVEADAGWERLAPLALALFQAKGDASTAARVVELAFLHGTTADVEALLSRFKVEARGFYRHLHVAVRAHLVTRLWREGAADGLATLLFAERDADWLQPIERLFVFHAMTGAADPATPYIFFRRYREALTNAVQEVGGYVGVTLPSFLIAVGRLAIELGYDGDARELLEQIGPGEPERDEALRLLLDVTIERDKAGRSHYVELLVGQSSSSERLRLLGQFLAATRGLGGIKDRNRPALNEVLKEPLAWLAEEPEAWATLSELLVVSRDLELLLPNLLGVFQAFALRFQAPLLDAALWQGPLGMHAETPRDQYWRGVALLHHYVTGGASLEASLWEAKALVTLAKRHLAEPLPYAWKELHKAAFGWVAKNHYVLEADRQAMLRQLRVAVDGDAAALADLEEWVEHADQPPLAVAGELQRLAAAKNAPALEARLILKRAQQTHLTNADLDRLWQLANERRDSDLAWRIATVLNARQALAPAARHAWEISGEKRAHYAFQVPPKAVVERCLKGFSGRAARLAYASLHVGPVLPELLALLDPGASPARLPAAPPDSVETKVDKALAQLAWLAAPRRRYRFSFEAASPGASLPAFAAVLPPNPWSLLVARLAERLGTNAWGWKLSRLSAQIVDLIPRLASRQDLRRQSGKVAGWLKDLTPEQRAAWQDLAALARTLEDQRAAEALACFLCRLATAILPNHVMALTSLQAMRAPVAVIWDLETWLLSDAYSEIRQELGIQSRVLVPNTLQRLASIVSA